MRIKRINQNVIAVFLTVTVLNIVSFLQFDSLSAQQLTSIRKHESSMAEADRMIAGSKSLTNSVRAFAATGDVQHEKAYWDEVKVTKSRDKAEAKLREFGLADSEIDLIERAKSLSDQLIELETAAFKAGNAGNLPLAIQLVYGDDYRKALASIYGPVDQFRQRLDKRLKLESDVLQEKVRVWWLVSISLALVNTLLVVYVLGFLYNRRLVQPLVHMNDEVRGMLEGRHVETSAVNSTHAVEEIGMLAASFDVLRTTHRKAEESHWVKSQVSDISSALQQSDTLRELGQAVMSKLAMAVGAGHGALYFSDGERHYSLLASFGYRERKHLANRFAIGEGLVGQCAMEKTPITLSAPKDYIRISSGLGEGPPACVSVVPVILRDRVLGVLEVASFQQFSAREQALLDAVTPVLATSLEILERNLKTRELLTSTQEQAERMEMQAARLEEQSVEMEAQQAELRETESWFRRIIDSSPDGLLVADEAGRVLLSNPKVEAVFGCGPGELVGSHVQHMVRADANQKDASSASVSGLFHPDKQQDGGATLFKALRKDGSEVDVLIAVTPLPAQGSRGQCTHLSVRVVSPSAEATGLDRSYQ